MKKALTITLYIKEVLHDIAQRAYRLGAAAKEPALRELMVDTQDEDGEELVMRSVQNAWSNVRHLLGEYLQHEDFPEATNLLMPQERGATPDEVLYGSKGRAYEPKEPAREDNDLTLRLLVPSNFNFAMADEVAGCAHQAVVFYALADWLANVESDASTVFSTQAKTAVQALNDAINKRVRPNRPHAPQNIKHNDKTTRYE